MTTIVIALADGFAEWETTLLGAVARSYYRAEVRYAAPGARPVTSMGGMTVTPDLALDAIDRDAIDALVVCGGTIWQTSDAPDLTALLTGARARGKVVGAICDGTIAAARSGILDAVRHTSNGAGHLDGTGYGGKARYENVPHAVTDHGIVTAPGTAPVSFMAEVMKATGLADDQLAPFVAMHAAQYGGSSHP
ncbi:MAG TPA: DJ-1/PfpI family protein [Devosia sp.]|nr:DJ-1/PfpI family protein [Devosia sp.]